MTTKRKPAAEANEQGNPPPATAEDAAERKFTRDVLVRGEAAPLDEDGKLPLSADFEITGDASAAEPEIKRRRLRLS